jgi:hypothetical protein
MVKEILKKALEDAVGYYNDGMSANDAIVKSASDHDLTIDQTDRVVESFNTAKTINFFDKNASDRTGKFDLASKKDVTLALFGNDSTEKKASAIELTPSELSSSFYFGAPDKSGNRKNIFAEKRAALLDAMASDVDEKWSHGFSDKTFNDMASDTYNVIKSAEADIKEAIGTIDSYLWSATEKIASGISKGAYDTPEDKANLFKVACPHKLVIDEVSKFCPLLKSASGGKYVKMNVVDTSLIDDLLKEADDIMYAVEQRKIYRQKQAEFNKKAETIKEAMLRDPSMSSIVPKQGPEFFLHKPETTKKADSGFGNLTVGNLVESVGDLDSRKKLNEQIRDDTRGALLADLLSSDPILEYADPRQVASIYKSLVATSPRVSTNKEIVRSILRSAVNSVAISPADSKILTDVDKGVQVAFGGLKDSRSDD